MKRKKKERKLLCPEQEGTFSSVFKKVVFQEVRSSSFFKKVLNDNKRLTVFGA